MIIKSSFGIQGDNIDYGTSGSVLTSNGPDNLPQWLSKVYCYAELNDRITHEDNIYDQLLQVVNMKLIEESHSGSYNEQWGVFRAPRNGIYYVDYNIGIYNYPVGVEARLSKTSLYIYVKRVGTSNFVEYCGNFKYLDSNITRMYMNVSSLINLNKNDEIVCKYKIQYNLKHGIFILEYLEVENVTRQSVFSIN